MARRRGADRRVCGARRCRRFHNYVFGHVLVLFSDNVNQPQTLLMSPLDYAKAAYEIAMLQFGGEHVRGALAQLYRWLSGPQELAVMIPLHAFAVALLVRVGVFGRRFDPWLRLLALATLLQHAIGATYVNYARYNLGTWFLTATVAAASARKARASRCCAAVCRASPRPGTAIRASSASAQPSRLGPIGSGSVTRNRALVMTAPPLAMVRPSPRVGPAQPRAAPAYRSRSGSLF